jgi:hypothetical protein
MKEMYRVCRNDSVIRITVPHPRHDDFMNDPTHVRVVTPNVMGHFSKRRNLEWKEECAANSPLALYTGVDFEIVYVEYIIDDKWQDSLRGKNSKYDKDEFMEALSSYNNVCKEIRMRLKVVK